MNNLQTVELETLGFALTRRLSELYDQEETTAEETIAVSLLDRINKLLAMRTKATAQLPGQIELEDIQCAS